MDAVLHVREDIYEYFQKNKLFDKYFQAHEEEYTAYYNSMFLLQDSTESLIEHRKKGFAKNPLIAYLEFWGVMQAVIIQQDSIKELYKVILHPPIKLDCDTLPSWLAVRDLRNICAGHPARRDKGSPLTRSFMARGFGDYSEIFYEQWKEGEGTTFPKIPLGALLDDYALEAERELKNIMQAMKKRWPEN